MLSSSVHNPLSQREADDEEDAFDEEDGEAETEVMGGPDGPPSANDDDDDDEASTSNGKKTTSSAPMSMSEADRVLAKQSAKNGRRGRMQSMSIESGTRRGSRFTTNDGGASSFPSSSGAYGRWRCCVCGLRCLACLFMVGVVVGITVEIVGVAKLREWYENAKERWKKDEKKNKGVSTPEFETYAAIGAFADQPKMKRVVGRVAKVQAAPLMTATWENKIDNGYPNVVLETLVDDDVDGENETDVPGGGVGDDDASFLQNATWRLWYGDCEGDAKPCETQALLYAESDADDDGEVSYATVDAYLPAEWLKVPVQDKGHSAFPLPESVDLDQVVDDADAYLLDHPNATDIVGGGQQDDDGDDNSTRQGVERWRYDLSNIVTYAAGVGVTWIPTRGANTRSAINDRAATYVALGDFCVRDDGQDGTKDKNKDNARSKQRKCPKNYRRANLVKSKNGVFIDASQSRVIPWPKPQRWETHNNIFYDERRDAFVATTRTKNDDKTKRAIGIALAPTLTDFGDPPVVFPTLVASHDNKWVPYAQITFAWHSVYLGLVAVACEHEDSKKVYSKLAYATDPPQDGWRLIDGDSLESAEQFIELGTDDAAFDSHVIYAARPVDDPITLDHRVYYMGGDAPHDDEARKTALGLAVVARDRFAGVTSSDPAQLTVTLTTVKLVCVAPYLTLTIDFPDVPPSSEKSCVAVAAIVEPHDEGKFYPTVGDDDQNQELPRLCGPDSLQDAYVPGLNLTRYVGERIKIEFQFEYAPILYTIGFRNTTSYDDDGGGGDARKRR